MRVLALNPPFHPRFSREMRSPAVTKSGTLYYPMWLAYAVGLIEKEGHTVLFIDAPAREYTAEETLSQITAFAPELVLMDTSTPSIFNDLQTAGEIKSVLPNTFILLLGPHVSALPE